MIKLGMPRSSGLSLPLGRRPYCRPRQSAKPLVMRSRTRSALVTALSAAGILCAWFLLKGPAVGSPGAVPNEPRRVLPAPEPPFRGKIGRTAADSKPDFPKEVQAPPGAPNVLL